MLGNTLKLNGLVDFMHTLSISFNQDPICTARLCRMIVLALAMIFLGAVFLRRDRARWR